MRKRYLLHLLIVVGSFEATIAWADPAAEIAAVNAEFDAAFQAGDAAAIAAIFTEDATMLAPGWTPLRGRSNIEEQYAAFLRAGFHDIEHVTDSLDPIGEETLVEVSHYAVKRTDGEGKTFDERGKSLTIWRRDDDGAWRIWMDMFNDLPPE